jgi:hypothetical protein
MNKCNHEQFLSVKSGCYNKHRFCNERRGILFIMESLFIVFTRKRLFMLFMCVRLFMLFKIIYTANNHIHCQLKVFLLHQTQTETRQAMHTNVILRCVRATTVAVENEYVLHIQKVCVCSPGHPVCNNCVQVSAYCKTFLFQST